MTKKKLSTEEQIAILNKKLDAENAAKFKACMEDVIDTCKRHNIHPVEICKQLFIDNKVAYTVVMNNQDLASKLIKTIIEQPKSITLQ